MKSAIELYQEAYQLHFKEGKPELARELYKEIIERYPDSDERKYSQFQLARTPSPVVSSSPSASSASFPVITSIALFIALISVAVTAGIFFLMQDEQKSSLYLEKIILATNAIQGQSADDAMVFIREAKTLQPKRQAAYSLASALYIKKNRFDLAESEYKVLLSYDPDNLFAHEQLNLITKRREEWKQKQLETQKTAETSPVQGPPQVIPPSLPEQRPDEGKKSQEAIDNSGVSYF